LAKARKVSPLSGLRKQREVVRHKRTKARDIIDIVEGRINLHLDPTWLPKEIVNGELVPELTEYLKPMVLSFRRAVKEKAGELVDRGATDKEAWDEVNELYQDFDRKLKDGLNAFLEDHGLGKSDRLDIPTGPVTREVARAIYNKREWVSDSQGRPVYQRKDGKNHLMLSFHHTPEMADLAKALWGHVKRLSPETVDVFLILLHRLACLRSGKDTASIRIEQIAEYRRIQHRDGSAGRLYADLLKDVKLLADLRLSIIWEVDGETLTYGTDLLPASLFYITGLEYRSKHGVREAFNVKAGEPMQRFLGSGGRGRLVGYCSRELLRLDPYHDALAKKIGVYWVLQAVVGATHGIFPSVRIGTVLDFCGETLNPKRPGDSVKQVIAAFQKVKDIGLIPEIPADLYPRERRRGYLDSWLNQKITIEVNPALCRLKGEEKPQLPSLKKGRSPEEDYGEAVKAVIYKQRDKDNVYIRSKKDVTIGALPIQEFRERYPNVEIELA
jgi:hypothetical protein